MDKILELTNPILLCVGICFIVFGLIMYIFPPKKINGLYGYRTASSMESQTKWDFAQKFSAKIMALIGLLLSIISFYKPYLGLDEDQDVILGIFFLLMTMILMITIVEKKLKKIS